MKEYDTVFPHGINVKDYIAIKAMQGILANSKLMPMSFADIAEQSYKISDAMIKQSEKE